MWMIDRLLLLLRQVLEFKQIQKLRPELLSLVVISLIMSGLWALIATKTRNLFGLSFRFQIQTIMKKHFENVFDTWCTPAYSYIRPTVEFAHFPFQRRSC